MNMSKEKLMRLAGRALKRTESYQWNRGLGLRRHTSQGISLLQRLKQVGIVSEALAVMRKRLVVCPQRMEPHHIVLKGRIGYHVLRGSLAALKVMGYPTHAAERNGKTYLLPGEKQPESTKTLRKNWKMASALFCF